MKSNLIPNPYSLIPNTRVYILFVTIALAFFACGKITDGDEDGISANSNNYGNDPIQNSNPPAGVITAVNSNSSITIGWGVVSGADGYYIYRSESSTGNYIQVGISATTSYEDNGLSAGTTYYYRVAAYNIYGTGSQSSLVSATTLLSAPTGVTATSSTNSIIFAWETIFGATGYYIYRSESALGIYTQVGISTSNSYTDNNLSAGTTYYYKVAAYNSGGIGALSSYASVMTTQPNMPTEVTATANSTSSITISWTAVLGATEYYIYSSESALGIYTQVGTSTSNSYTDNNLSAGTTYYYKVAAYNSGGVGSLVYARTITTQCDNQTFNTVVIGTQTWMAENLNCNVSGSKCYGDDDENCAIYGRLYYWATAMNLPSDCNSAICSGQVQSKHQGICPSGWHIPTNAEWATLENYVGGSGKYLKTTSGWYDCGPSGSGNSYLCEDTYGFAALPGGLGYSDGSFNFVGYYGYWWSASDEDHALVSVAQQEKVIILNKNRLY